MADATKLQQGVCRCGHLVDEHTTRRVCQVVIHYPSEDYPCHCGGEGEIKDGACVECEHRATEHVRKRRCSPLSGELCACVEVA